MTKTVYFLGAGSTIDAAPHAPSNKTLVEKALLDFSESLEAQNIKSFIRDLFHRPNFLIDNQVWNLLDYIIQEGKSPCSKYNLEQIVEIRKNLLKLIIQEFQKSLETIEPTLHKNFVEKIKSSPSTIISTNYDILIDSAASRTVGLNYGAKARNYVFEGYTQGGFYRPATYEAGISINEGQIPLLKIHGSLNWLYCPKCDEIDVTAGKGAVRTVAGDYYCHNTKCTSKYSSLLITPTMFKNYENRFIRETWLHAEKALTEADRLIFIGYALKDEDYQIRCLLMKALLNKNDSYKEVVVIEKKPAGPEEKKSLEETVKRKFEDLYGTVDYRAIGFTEFVSSLP